MSIKLLRKSLTLFATLLLVACGGGGGGGGDDDDSGVTYTGLTTPAVITNANAKTLAEGALGGSTTGTAFGVVSDEQEVQPDPTILDVARILSNSVTQLDISPSSPILPGAIVTESGSEPCDDDGSISIDISIDDETFDFFGTFVFINCAEGGTTINGDASVSGTFGEFDALVLDLVFDTLTVVSGAESYTMSGTIDTSATASGATITMDVRSRNNNTQLVEWLNNITISVTGSSPLVMTITGRYYHPEHGYVDIVTNTALQINVADQWPNVGQMTMTGASGSKTRLTVIDNTQYTLEVDADGDDIYETSTLEDWG